MVTAHTRLPVAIALVLLGAVSGAAQQAPPNPHESLRQMGIVGYADRMSVQPGETIRFMVSSQSPRYRADIVRLIHGDINPKGPGFKEVLVETPVSGEYSGRHQDLPLGSYAIVPDAPALRLAGSFTITAWIAPTAERARTSTPLLPNVTLPSMQLPGPVGVAGIVTKWSAADQSGYGLVLDEEGRLALWIGGKGGRAEKLTAPVPLRPWVPTLRLPRGYPQGVATAWYFVAASFDAATGRVTLYQHPLNDVPDDPTRVVVEHTAVARALGSSTEPLLIAAIRSAADRIGGHYNGKIDNPRLYGRALTRQEITTIQQGGPVSGALASWDFAADIETDRISDTGPHALHGTTVNLPTRAVTGHTWNGTEANFKSARSQYSAIYFHDDDLGDARWDVGFELRVPDSLKSGVYAARLRTDTKEDYVPFFVRPRKGTTGSNIALLIPTFSYMAYGGTSGSGITPLSVYSRHTNGAPGNFYATYLRPITNMRPKLGINPWQFTADTHLVDWLEVKGFTVDVITDHDLHVEGIALLKPYKVVVSGSHPEYPSWQMLEAIRGYLNQGGRFMYMGGNGFYWVTSVGPGGRHIEVRKRDGARQSQAAPGEYYHSTDGAEGGLWRSRGVPPQMIFGVGSSGVVLSDPGVPYKRMPGSFDPRAAFIFEGIGRDELIGDFPSLVLEYGAAGSELDRVDYALGSPPHTLILATAMHTAGKSSEPFPEEPWNGSYGVWRVEPELPRQLSRADLAFLEYPNGGAMFSTGSITWCGSLSFNNYSNTVSRVTENVLRRFAADAPIPGPGAGWSGERSTAR
jgi:N,N-dimethylformamidase